MRRRRWNLSLSRNHRMLEAGSGALLRVCRKTAPLAAMRCAAQHKPCVLIAFQEYGRAMLQRTVAQFVWKELEVL